MNGKKKQNTPPNGAIPGTRVHEYLRACDAADYCSLSKSKLDKLRMRANRSQGPAFIKTGSVILYRRSDLDAWMEQNTVSD